MLKNCPFMSTRWCGIRRLWLSLKRILENIYRKRLPCFSIDGITLRPIISKYLQSSSFHTASDRNGHFWLFRWWSRRKCWALIRSCNDLIKCSIYSRKSGPSLSLSWGQLINDNVICIEDRFCFHRILVQHGGEIVDPGQCETVDMVRADLVKRHSFRPCGKSQRVHIIGS